MALALHGDCRFLEMMVRTCALKNDAAYDGTALDLIYA